MRRRARDMTSAPQARGLRGVIMFFAVSSGVRSP